MKNKGEKYIRDPLHGLIAFDLSDETDCLAWNLIQTRAFQRLRHIRQLGFVDLVFPGATHTRFSHSMGVFHLARKLLRIVKNKTQKNDSAGAPQPAAIAALLHDLGHGPFSHAFEDVTGIKHEEMTLRIIEEDEEIARLLEPHHLSQAIKKILEKQEPRLDGAIVSSQFDADRLDYMQRDRYMTGMGGSGFDLEWLLRCLEVDSKTKRFYLNHKGMHHAEEYLLARHHLYIHVYMHKAARGAEYLLREFFDSLHDSLDGFSKNEVRPFPKILSGEFSVEDYLAVNDASILEIMGGMRGEKSNAASLADALLSHQLPKSFDASSAALAQCGNAKKAQAMTARFKKKIKEECDADSFYFDERTISAYRYGRRGTDGREEEPIWAQASEDGEIDDLKNLSSIVRTIPEHPLFRLYSRDAKKIEEAEGIWEDFKKIYFEK